MIDKPGFTVEEILRAKQNGDNIAAIKMLRAETGCGLQDAVAILRDGTIAEIPTFKMLRLRRSAERHGLELFELLKVALRSTTEHDCDVSDWRINAQSLITKIEKE